MDDKLLKKVGSDSEPIDELNVRLFRLHNNFQELNSDELSTQAAALRKIAKTKNPDAIIGTSTVADILLSYCCQGDCRVRATAISCLSNWANFDPVKPNTNYEKEKHDWISNNWLKIYILACKILTEDNAKVRQVTLKSIHTLSLNFGHNEFNQNDVIALESASLDSQIFTKRINALRRKTVTLIDDAFSRICDRFQDGSRFVRVTAAELIADLAEVNKINFKLMRFLIGFHIIWFNHT